MTRVMITIGWLRGIIARAETAVLGRHPLAQDIAWMQSAVVYAQSCKWVTKSANGLWAAILPSHTANHLRRNKTKRGQKR